MHYRDLITNLARELPFPRADFPERLLEATLTALFEAVPERTAIAVLAALPGAPGALTRMGRVRGAETRAQLSARVAELLGESEARAIEEAEVVCAVLDRALPGDERALLWRSLPEDLASLFDHSSPRSSARETRHGHTLADGAPGGTHPLSESAPGSRHPVSAARPGPRHEHSVAEENPHGETKLASARGLTQEREQESLSEGRSKRS